MTAPKKTRTIRVTTIEVHGLGKYPLRLTEAGAEPLTNGAKVVLPFELAQALVFNQGSHVRFAEGTVHHPKTEEKEVEASWRYEILSGKAASPVATEEKKEPVKKEPAKVGKAANRSMAGKTEAKG